MMVRVANISAVAQTIPGPFAFTLAAATARDVPLHVRDIVEYRSNPARVDDLREIEQMLKDRKITITVLARDPNDFDLEDLLFVAGGGAWNQKGSIPVLAPAAAVPVVFPQPMPSTNYRVKGVVLEGVGGPPQPFAVSALGVGGFLVTFAAPWGPGTLYWEIEFLA